MSRKVTSPTPHGLIILVQSVHDTIPETDILQAIPEDWLKIPRKIIPIISDQIPHGDQNIPMRDLMDAQRIIYEEKVVPVLADHPSYEVLYFGMAPIPLCIHFGYLIGPLQRVSVFHKHHFDNTWRFSEGAATFKQEIHDVPSSRSLAVGEAIIRYESSRFTIHEKDCLLHVNTPLSHTYVEHVKHESQEAKSADPFTRQDEVFTAAETFRKVLDTIQDQNPNTQTIHLFASVQPEVAFLMGKQVYKTASLPIQLYQYHREGSSAYTPTGRIPSDDKLVIHIREEDKKNLATLRQELAKELTDRVQPFIQGLMDADKSWRSEFEQINHEGLQAYPWSTLKNLQETNLITDHVQLEELDTNERTFYDKEAQAWLFNDPFLYMMHIQFEDESSLKRAVRLLWFHESIHFACHKITSGTSRGVGSFPKILEELDYQADVYAICNEYAYSQRYEPGQTKQIKKFFLELIRVITDTMWAFDAMESRYEMELRRINRYLIWYFQYAQISALSNPDIAAILHILSRKPFIELKGLKLQPNQKQRHLVQLRGYRSDSLEIALIINNQIEYRSSNPDRAELDKLVKAFQERKGDAIRSVLKNILDLIDGG
ncbi:MAG: SAVED domain-containing protein [Bacteroidota bacterium]